MGIQLFLKLALFVRHQRGFSTSSWEPEQSQQDLG